MTDNEKYAEVYNKLCDTQDSLKAQTELCEGFALANDRLRATIATKEIDLMKLLVENARLKSVVDSSLVIIGELFTRLETK